jgi:hypothetical protein
VDALAVALAYGNGVFGWLRSGIEARLRSTAMSSTAMSYVVSLLGSAVVGLALTGQTLSQNPGGHFGFGGPLGAANGLGPPALRGGIGGGIGSPVGGGSGGSPSGGPAVVAAPGMAAGTLNGTASTPGAGTPAGPAVSSLSGASTPYAFSSGGRPQPRELSAEEKEKLEQLDRQIAAMDKQLGAKLHICKGC